MISVILCNSIMFFLIFPSLIVFDQSSWPSRHFRGLQVVWKLQTSDPCAGARVAFPNLHSSKCKKLWGVKMILIFCLSKILGHPKMTSKIISNSENEWCGFFLGSGDAWLNWRFQPEHKAGRTEMPSTSDPFPYMVPPFWDLKYLRLKRK